MCAQSVQMIPLSNQIMQIILEPPKSHGLSEETKKLIKFFTGSGWNNTEEGCLEGFFKLLSGCSNSYLISPALRGSRAFHLLFTSLPKYDEKVFNFMKFYSKARLTRYSLNFKVCLFDMIERVKTPDNNRKAFVNAYNKAMMIALAIFVDQVSVVVEKNEELTETNIKTLMKGIVKNFGDIWYPENITTLMKQVKNVKSLLKDYLKNGMNIAQRIVLMYMINDLIYKIYIHITHKPLTSSNYSETTELMKMACEVGLISENDYKRFNVYLNHVVNHCWGCGCDEKYKAIALLFGYSNGLSLDKLIKFIEQSF